MGSIITLSLGNLEVDWGKNFNHTDHSALFLPSNKKKVWYKYFDIDEQDKVIHKRQPALVTSLRDIVPRLELLGYTVTSAKTIYNSPIELGYVEESNILPFEEILDALKHVEIKSLPLNYKDNNYDPGEFVEKEVLSQLKLLEKDENDSEKSMIRSWMGDMLENFHPWAILRLLAENPANLGIPVIWYFNDVVENGWVKEEDILKPVEQEFKFIIVTEGSSDTYILKEAFNKLRPNTKDFFTFIDMEKGYPFVGIGNLHNFCQGLVKIGVLNNILVIYDNDTEGTSKFKEAELLDLPKNMRIMKLPSLIEFSKFSTVGPTGNSVEDINGKAVAIECFLDLNEKRTEPVVRWTGFNSKINQYQGELINKTEYTKQFLKMKNSRKVYDYSKLDKLLDEIHKECVLIAESKIL